MVLAMIRDLPQHSRLSARTAGTDEAEDVELDPETLAYLDRREWGQTDRLLGAAQVNLLGDLLRFVPSWKEGKAPDLTPVGPMSWRGEGPKQETKKRPSSIEDAMRVFGWTG